ncbi:16S rRNA (guanine(527)-N(7))-methyltransferase RsmG [Phaeovulum vinaykumarii]|uniref:Ribosomal RNA small subunit methyltransferase G n=1 Tax=Phaeovulum vinaykumarii TaxID=407234 RepID=A0A1N7MB04_9RHOB|nr:16S rRNA (guanine(527)-N(7))-methyltransferase RsmG [Phaeovulum vinaykumarii]SIS83159.1 16S rRNA (guanine527-N7)-methyltransferase [Phaeovulum vinaykumarii]SOC10396.1 16S rRNA (guanine527-N7)-methyltransferase [Phaeovulum vinaykumarii]
MSIVDRDAFAARTAVSRETLAAFDAYAALLTKWSRAINLVAPGTLDALWGRHFLDSAQVFELLPGPARHLADLGSGAGFPAIPLAIMARERAPDLTVTLVESDRRKAAFLETVIRDLGLSARVETARIESLAPLGADVLTARALAPLDRLATYAQRHLAPGGVAIFPKGKAWRDELAAAQAHATFTFAAHPSITDKAAVLLEIRDLSLAQ